MQATDDGAQALIHIVSLESRCSRSMICPKLILDLQAPTVTIGSAAFRARISVSLEQPRTKMTFGSFLR